MLPHVIEFNRRDAEAAAIYDSLGGSQDIAQRVRDHLRRAGMDASLGEQGLDLESLPQLAEEAAVQWTARFNPVTVTAADLEVVYRAAM